MSKPTTIRLNIDEGPKKGETLARTPGGGAIRIGRVVRWNTIAIRDPSISQKHLSVEFDPDTSRWTVTDLGTSNATSVNGVRVVPAVPFPLSDGDSVKIGGSTLISVKIEDGGDEVAEGSRRIGGKRGRRGGPVRVSVVDDRIEPPKRGKTVGVGETGVDEELGRGRRRSSRRVLKKDEILDPVCVENELGKRRRQNYTRVSKDEILDSVRVEDGTDAQVKLQRGRKGNCSRDSKEDEVLSTLVVSNEETAKVERRRRKRGKSDSALKEDQVSDTVVVEHQIKVQDKDVDPVLVEDVAVAGTRKKLPRVRRGNSSRVAKTNEAMNIQTLDTVVTDSSEAQESLGRERRGILAKVSQKGEALVPLVEVSIDVPKILPRGRRGNSSRVLKTNETMDTFVKESTELQENIGRGRKGVISEVSQKREASVLAVEGSTDVPKNLGRGRRSTRTQVLKKDEILDSVAEENIERPKTLRRGRTSSNMGLKKESVLDFAPDSSTQVPKNVGRTRRTGSNKVLKDDEILDSIVEESVKVPQDLKRGSRIGSSRVSKKNETLDSGVEDRTEDPANLGRGKKRACSTRVSKKDNLVDLVEKSIIIPDGEGRPRRAPARRTRAASARLSTKEQLLESAPLNLKGLINPVENIYHHKELTGDSNRLGQSEKIQLVSLATSSPKEFNRRKHRTEFNKENHSLVKSQRRENEELMRSSCSKQIPDDEGPSSGSVANVAEPSHVLPKVWNGNGIPNTTSKYKEDSKVSFHATPFEERLEKALSGDKHVTKRS